jgi:hypothetical protein
MAAFRERHCARDGVGHADRPRLHNALSLDAQSRSVRLSLAGGRRHSHSNSNVDTYRNANSDSHCDSNSNGYGNTETYTHTESCTDAEAASYAATTAIARNEQQLVMRCSGDEPLPGDGRSAYSLSFGRLSTVGRATALGGMSLAGILQLNAKNY